ncbi:DUF1444 family protein [Chitinophaga sancti]|uniref:DUF1444 family protein n=1 Tax=Chitinophaga sancti TaxID=1004 RepID=A0A1K1SJ41_9BACT|nr:DUF1444 family protein [Chitinophaga sancti]WQD64479.1 DUF1444 family protein [Chitinophaga sancti]WQG89897.1 DUF1444 family protein [Chitinophaga sancti]SFW84440.1 Uncharacterized protein YtpQ, UPF0354 family [Chitinophaga sancti]
MRLTIVILLAVMFASCKFKHPVLDQEEFAQAYLKELHANYPAVKFVPKKDFSISAESKAGNFTFYLDNAYRAYQQEPDSLAKVLRQYMGSASLLFREKQKMELSTIVPVIKPITYLDDLKKAGNSLEMATKAYNDQLVIVYAEDLPEGFKYLTKKDFDSIGISADSLHELAIENFYKQVPNIETYSKDGRYMLAAGGNYEASLILLPSLWMDDCPVNGDFVVAIPSRDLIFITGSKNKAGLDSLKHYASEGYGSGIYTVSDHLFRWNGSIFEKY